MRLATVLLPLLIIAAGCTRAPRLATEVVAAAAPKLPTLPSDPLWDVPPEHQAKLVPQDQVEPRVMTPTTPEVFVRALTNGSELSIRLDWADDSKNDAPGAARMMDACAIQIPEKIEKDLPEPQMGQEGRTVQVTYWRADWQASVDGRADTLAALQPNATVDHYPYEARSLDQGSDAQREMMLRYSPARALGNLRAGPRTVPVEELVAQGPGTLSPGPSLGAKGKGEHRNNRWYVVMSRRLPEGLTVNQRTSIAFAVWQGSKQESGARKMRTGWIPLVRRGAR